MITLVLYNAHTNLYNNSFVDEICNFKEYNMVPLRCSLVASPAKKKTSVIAAAVAAAAATGATSLSVPSSITRRGSMPDIIKTELASINEQIGATAMLVRVFVHTIIINYNICFS